MQFGAVFPHLEIGTNPEGIREWTHAVEDLGYEHILAYDHVLGADTSNRPGWVGYTSDSLFHEVMVLFGYLAAITRLELVTGILILPQRQTALVAKQAAEIDVLTGGRLRLGVGVGWNPVEYEALGEDFHTRGARCDEQIDVLRALWNDSIISFSGRWHTIEAAGLNPLPVQRPISIWFGAGRRGSPAPDVVLRRIGRLGDGWFPQRDPGDDAREEIERVRSYAREAGRNPDDIGVEPRLNVGRVPDAEWTAFRDTWQELGATHLSVNTMDAGFTSLGAHLDALKRAKAALSV